jgi:omega-hydroxy-beta-dihydromenaquinone-9 sulfotransferase
MASTSAPSKTNPERRQPRGAKNAYPWYSPRFWHGMTWGAWLALIFRHRLRIHPIRWPMAFLITLITPFNSVMGAVQSLIYGRRIRETQLKEPPVFIVGHWRSGTTYLHELMSLDDRFGSPTTYQCFAPMHFLLTEWFMTRFMFWLVPKQRPMDNMAASWTAPQEDEFALLTLNAPTPYFRMAFPNDPPPHMELLNMQGVSPRDQARFEETLLGFARLITFHYGKRLLFKSPPHTGRLETLTRLFPGATFIHITRDPYAIFSSTRKLWESLDDVQGLQRPRHEHLDEYIYDCFERMYSGFEEQRSRLAASSVIDLKYEDLVQDPVGHVQELYERLGLGDFQPVREKLAADVAGKKDYKTNRHELPQDLKEQIRQRWAGYFERYGYPA